MGKRRIQQHTAEELVPIIAPILTQYPPETYLANPSQPFRAFIDADLGLLFEEFREIYKPGTTPQIIAAQLLKSPARPRRSRSYLTIHRHKDISKQHRLIRDVETLLRSPEQFLKDYSVPLDTAAFYRLIAEAHRLRRRWKSIDRWCDSSNHPETIRSALARALVGFYEVMVLFRNGQFNNYWVKSRTLRLLPEAGSYHRKATREGIPTRGKWPVREKIVSDARQFSLYLRPPHKSRLSKDGKGYEAARFRFLASLIGRIEEVLKQKAPRTPSPKTLSKKPPHYFSIDEEL